MSTECYLVCKIGQVLNFGSTHDVKCKNLPIPTAIKDAFDDITAIYHHNYYCVKYTILISDVVNVVSISA